MIVFYVYIRSISVYLEVIFQQWTKSMDNDVFLRGFVSPNFVIPLWTMSRHPAETTRNNKTKYTTVDTSGYTDVSQPSTDSDFVGSTELSLIAVDPPPSTLPIPDRPGDKGCPNLKSPLLTEGSLTFVLDVPENFRLGSWWLCCSNVNKWSRTVPGRIWVSFSFIWGGEVPSSPYVLIPTLRNDRR